MKNVLLISFALLMSNLAFAKVDSYPWIVCSRPDGGNSGVMANTDGGKDSTSEFVVNHRTHLLMSLKLVNSVTGESATVRAQSPEGSSYLAAMLPSQIGVFSKVECSVVEYDHK